ncbi:hypothetical protein E4634_08165 [Mangrovimicrobium sediminis]|uniref:Nuclear transport factor 2 family protein n=1 Tax=Mangrovimicrobium sediminis TaxID=2562682 RepID=A0A4Z0M3J4_9GAMM|nr:hypothetical protein [Haliea sp. SAOS-164]TGD74099.1 hypothetical protein E4634_08165 [Haliea sp. SAOS-164]
MKMVKKNSMLRVILMSFVVLLAACSKAPAPAGEPSSTSREALELRAQERWRARVARDWEKAYEYESPAFREVFPKHLYVKKFSYTANWELTGLEVINYDPDAAVASVAVRVMSKPAKQTTAAARALGAMPRELREKWILVDGEWWYSITN